MFEALTKEKINWLCNEASTQQGCLHGDTCKENRESIEQIRKELFDCLELMRVVGPAHLQVIDLFLERRGLKRTEV